MGEFGWPSGHNRLTQDGTYGDYASKNQVVLVGDEAAKAVERTLYVKLQDIALDQIFAAEIAAAESRWMRALVSPTGIEPVSSASYHFGFRRLINVRGLDYAFAMGPVGPVGRSRLVSTPSRLHGLGSALPRALAQRVHRI